MNGSSAIAPLKFPLTSLQCGSLLQQLTNSKSLRTGRRLHALILVSNLLSENTYLSTKLCAMYAVCGETADARLLFDRVVLKSSFLWNIMIRGYTCCGLSTDAILLYREMLVFGKRGDNFTYPFVVKACGELGVAEIGRRVHCEALINGYHLDTFVGNSLICMYSKFGDMAVARQVFDGMPHRDLTTWNTVISGYVKNSDPENAVLLFAYLVKESGLRAESATFVSVLPAFADLPSLDRVKEIHGYLVRSGMGFCVSLVNALIDVYGNCNSIQGARQLFEGMSERDIVSWNSMIMGYIRIGNAVHSLKLFQRLHLEGLQHDQITCVTVLQACAQIAALELGSSIHAHVVKRGFMEDVVVGTTLVDMYAKCGNLSFSCGVFYEMPERSLLSWTAMISAYGLHGKGREAMDVLNNMKEKGILPDGVTLTSALSACSHAGLVEEGRHLFNQILNDYSIEPKVEHYTCMVDLLGRAGRLDEAHLLVKNMNIKPNADVWVALLLACCIRRNLKLAEIAAQNAFTLKPKDVGPYISLSNIYAREERWEDVEMVRTLMRKRGLKKKAGCSYIEFDGVIHRFLVGDKAHPQSDHIYFKLEELKHLVDESAYEPDTSCILYNVEEEAKQQMLWDHSERLAIAFALIRTPVGMTIRITKNLRICRDCHAVTKLITKLVNRDVVMRDAHRFHHFSGGFCSCGDYW